MRNKNDDVKLLDIKSRRIFLGGLKWEVGIESW